MNPNFQRPRSYYDPTSLPPLPDTPVSTASHSTRSVYGLSRPDEGGVSTRSPRKDLQSQPVLFSPNRVSPSKTALVRHSPSKSPRKVSPVKEGDVFGPTVTQGPSVSSSPTRRPLATPKTKSPRTSLSFQLPQNAIDASLIVDCSFGGRSDDSLDFGIDRLRPDKDLRLAKQQGSSVKSTPVAPKREETLYPLSTKRPPSERRHGTDRSKRTFPASSSGRSLAAVGENDVSTLFPVSPAKSRHLLNDLVKAETMDLGPVRRTPGVKSNPSHMRRTPGRMNAGDMTMDVRDLMARMPKPKRASGTEESFVDLLHEVDALDLDGEFLPAALRPQQPKPTATKSPVKLSSLKESPVRQSSIRQSPVRPLPIKAESRTRLTGLPTPKPVSASSRPALPTPKPVAYTPRPSGLPSRRISLSTGALAMPTSASIPEPRLGLARTGSIGRGMSSTSSLASSTKRLSAPPVKTTTSAVPTAAARSSRLSLKPTTRPLGLPQPGTGPTARSAVVPTKVFGDAATGLNRGSSTVQPRMKLSMDSSPVKTVSNSRAISTPATTVARSRLSTLPVPKTMTPKVSVPTAESRIPGASSRIAGIADLRARMERLQAKQARKGVERL